VRLAWFTPRPDDVALELRRRHHVDLFNAERAHDFVWMHFRQPYDLTVVELADTPAYAYVWPYLFHDPGIVILRATSVQRSRSELLHRQHRPHDLRAERSFGGPSLLGAPLAAARLVVVFDAAIARELRTDYPDVEVRILPNGVAPARLAPRAQIRFRYASAEAEIVERAAMRAREAGATVETAAGLADLADGDVVIALEWPPTGAPPLEALSAMAAGLTVVVFETEAVAAWPTLDPQTWQPRGYGARDAPLAISLDPRDEEHSLMLVMKRLSSDAALRDQLGTSAAEWAANHASVTAAAAAWEPVLQDALTARQTSVRDALPAHLTADGTSRARAVLAELRVTVDVL
jgi:hypothetical protein